MNPNSFIGQALRWAKIASSKTGLYTSLILAQWIDETGWGGPDWYVRCNPGNISENGLTIVYPSLYAGVNAYINLINNQYPNLRTGATPQAQAIRLGASNWASSHYDITGGGVGSDLINIITTYNLERFDSMSTTPNYNDRQFVALAPTPTGKGYWILDSYGEVYSFGDAEYFGGLTPEGQQVGTPQA